MAKQLSGVLKLYVAAGKAAPSPPLGPALGQVSLFLAISPPFKLAPVVVEAFEEHLEYQWECPNLEKSEIENHNQPTIIANFKLTNYFDLG